jgi:membrane-associated phospholipid phosphatase
MLVRYAIAYFIVQLIASVIITRVLKFAIGRARPSDYSEKQIASLRNDAFPSGHSADMSSSASTLSYFLSIYFLRVISYLCVAAMGLSRIAVGSHYPLDVIGGTFIGLFTGYIICHVFAVRFTIIAKEQK